MHDRFNKGKHDFSLQIDGNDRKSSPGQIKRHLRPIKLRLKSHFLSTTADVWNGVIRTRKSWRKERRESSAKWPVQN